MILFFPLLGFVFNKILHFITRPDIGGSAQNTLLTCLKFNRKYAMVLA
jgi:hypothetical protein